MVTPPNMRPSSEMKDSAFACLTAAGSAAIENAERRGLVSSMVTTTAIMARAEVFLSGKRMAGASWFRLSSPENASHAPP